MNFFIIILPIYLDPGSGSLIAQLIAAGVLGAGIFVKLMFSRIKKWLSGSRGKPEAVDAAEDVKNL